ncbi:FCS-Like Zinc finger 5-like [Cornus florida]|uniref:FCS-Like Zinc finger 5-like n=1 Tax=Cornus florida TaxID=4283 RepID=UPI00289C2AC9|nr:FCS-Like Zinc finger 5-like [Cornus florida]
MSLKHNRVVQSSSAGEMGQLNQVQPIQSPVTLGEKKRATAAQIDAVKPVKNSEVSVTLLEEPYRSILTLGSPVCEKKIDGSEDKIDDRFGRFLGACFHCKKKLALDKDVFMYGYLRAFCTIECRDKQIAVDEKDNKPSPVSTAAATRLTEATTKRGFGSQVNRQAVARF